VAPAASVAAAVDAATPRFERKERRDFVAMK
jgi:hypothetical protein